MVFPPALGSLLLSITGGAALGPQVFWIPSGEAPAHPLASHVLIGIPVQVLPENVLETALPGALAIVKPPGRVALPE